MGKLLCAVLGASEPNDDQAELLRDGMEILVGLLGSVMSGLGEEIVLTLHDEGPEGRLFRMKAW